MVHLLEVYEELKMFMKNFYWQYSGTALSYK